MVLAFAEPSYFDSPLNLHLEVLAAAHLEVEPHQVGLPQGRHDANPWGLGMAGAPSGGGENESWIQLGGENKKAKSWPKCTMTLELRWRIEANCSTGVSWPSHISCPVRVKQLTARQGNRMGL